MKRFVLPIAGIALLMILCAPSALALRSGERITRAELVRQAVDVLYGETGRAYTAPYENMPVEAKNQIGVARILNSVSAWGRDGDWLRPVTRGEALAVVLTLAQKNPSAGMSTEFRDVRGREPSRLVGQALEWRLFEPLTPRTFGWSRLVTTGEFSILIERVGTRVQTPLSIPTEQVRPVPARTKRTPRSGTLPTRGRKTTPRKVGITIELGEVDRGVSKVQSRELPKKDLLETVWGIVQDKFLYQDRIKRDEIAYAIADAIMQKLEDPYSVFLPPRVNRRFQEQIEGGNRSFFGIGAHVRTHKDGGVEVVTPIPGSPAMKAGVKSGDRIIEVDGVSVLKMNLDEAVDMIRGPDGVSVRLTIERDGMGSAMQVTVIRGNIVVKDLFVSEQEGVAIIRLTSFSRGVMQEINGVFKEVMDTNPQGIILDLRNNPGGLLDAAILVSSHFLKEGDLIVTVEKRTSKKEHRAVGGARPIPMSLPVAVLTNKGSASASEIVAGALKDHSRAEIIGQTTFGKGTVQEAMEFAPQSGESPPAVKITVARWLTPEGHEIDDNGVTPTIKMPESESGSRDEVLLEAIRVIKAKKR